MHCQMVFLKNKKNGSSGRPFQESENQLQVLHVYKNTSIDVFMGLMFSFHRYIKNRRRWRLCQHFPCQIFCFIRQIFCHFCVKSSSAWGANVRRNLENLPKRKLGFPTRFKSRRYSGEYSERRIMSLVFRPLWYSCKFQRETV